MFWRRAKGPNVSLLTDDIAVGAQPSRRDLQALRKMGILGIVDLRDETPDASDIVRAAGFHYIRLPVVEGAAPSPEVLAEVTAWIDHHISTRGPVLVHCREGRGRSAMVAVATLVRLGLPLTEAYSLLMRARPSAVLNTRQMHALEEFARSPEVTKAA